MDELAPTQPGPLGPFPAMVLHEHAPLVRQCPLDGIRKTDPRTRAADDMPRARSILEIHQ
jgi:hypothetical protein